MGASRLMNSMQKREQRIKIKCFFTRIRTAGEWRLLERIPRDGSSRVNELNAVSMRLNSLTDEKPKRQDCY